MPDQIDDSSELDLFADDSTAFEIDDSIDAAMVKMSKTANDIEQYSKRNSLSIHPGKCKILTISKKPFIGPIPTIEIDKKPVETVTSAKCLWVTIDNRLSWEPNIKDVCRRFYAKLKKLYKMRSMSKDTLKTIYFQGILPSAIYSILIWGSSNHLSDVNKIHIKAAHFIMKIKKNVSDNLVLNLAKWKPIDFYYKKALACKTFKIFNELSPDFLSSLISKRHV